ncbi:hypothetical protein G6F42_016004 [Rhizopus arrhizus]|nr:hypothetical protein G6F42_016004 [Rhizopus arrhizus]
MYIVTTRESDKPNHRVTIKLKRSIKLKWPAIDNCTGKHNTHSKTLLRRDTIAQFPLLKPLCMLLKAILSESPASDYATEQPADLATNQPTINTQDDIWAC